MRYKEGSCNCESSNGVPEQAVKMMNFRFTSSAPPTPIPTAEARTAPEDAGHSANQESMKLPGALSI